MAKYIKIETELKKESDWISHYLIRAGYHLDYTTESFKEIDRLFEEDISLIFYNEVTNYHSAISIYIATVLVLTHKAQWNIKEYNNSESEKYRNIFIEFKDKTEINAFQIINDVIKKEYSLVEYINNIS